MKTSTERSPLPALSDLPEAAATASLSNQWNETGDETTKARKDKNVATQFGVLFYFRWNLVVQTAFHKFLIFINTTNTFSWPHKNMLNRMFISSSVLLCCPLRWIVALGGRSWAVASFFPMKIWREKRPASNVPLAFLCRLGRESRCQRFGTP